MQINIADNNDAVSAAFFAAKYQKLSRQEKTTLRALASGVPVDAHAAQQATFSALQCSVTANGHSRGRRLEFEKVRRLWDTITSLIGTEAPQGTAPEAVEELEQSLVDYSNYIAKLKRENARLYKQAVEQNDIIERLRSDLQRYVERASLAEHDVARTAAYSDKAVKVSEYARSLLDQIGRAKVEGFIDGLTEA